jgi:hypothetical protein
MQDGRVTLQDIFMLGRNRAGQVGFFSTGYVPIFIQQAPSQGVQVPTSLFGVAQPPAPPAPPAHNP